MTKISATSTIDIVERVRQWRRDYFAPPPSEWLDEAADEIERLRMTDADRAALQDAVDFCEQTDKPLPSSEQIAAIRDLLKRHCATSTR